MEDSDDFYKEHDKKYTEFMESMSEKEQEIYKKIIEENKKLLRYNAFDYMEDEINKLDTYDEIIIAGSYKSYPDKTYMKNQIKIYNDGSSWFVEVVS